jgi:type II restriction enzyme
MPETYNQTIARLIAAAPFDIDTDVKVEGRPPSMASSEFLTNKEQGDWAERLVTEAINANSTEFIALHYGRSESLAAGDPGFAEFYTNYQDELNRIGKKPDLLIFRRTDIPNPVAVNLDDATLVEKAIAAIEVRSSSFLANKYNTHMATRARLAEEQCEIIRNKILQEPFLSALREKSPAILQLLQDANNDTFRELDFRLPSWASSPVLLALTAELRLLKEQIKILHKRDYLSITPKLEDLALVNRWIQNFGVRHFYLQVFFDTAYFISFKEILEVTSNPANEDILFSVERDVKNQGKTTLKTNIQTGREIIGKIDMPDHKSVQKELERGRLLFYVRFEGGRGYLDTTVFNSKIIHDAA